MSEQDEPIIDVADQGDLENAADTRAEMDISSPLPIFLCRNRHSALKS